MMMYPGQEAKLGGGPLLAMGLCILTPEMYFIVQGFQKIYKNRQTDAFKNIPHCCYTSGEKCDYQ